MRGRRVMLSTLCQSQGDRESREKPTKTDANSEADFIKISRAQAMPHIYCTQHVVRTTAATSGSLSLRLFTLISCPPWSWCSSLSVAFHSNLTHPLTVFLFLQLLLAGLAIRADGCFTFSLLFFPSRLTFAWVRLNSCRSYSIDHSHTVQLQKQASVEVCVCVWACNSRPALSFISPSSAVVLLQLPLFLSSSSLCCLTHSIPAQSEWKAMWCLLLLHRRLFPLYSTLFARPALSLSALSLTPRGPSIRGKWILDSIWVLQSKPIFSCLHCQALFLLSLCLPSCTASQFHWRSFYSPFTDQWAFLHSAWVKLKSRRVKKAEPKKSSFLSTGLLLWPLGSSTCKTRALKIFGWRFLSSLWASKARYTRAAKVQYSRNREKRGKDASECYSLVALHFTCKEMDGAHERKWMKRKPQFSIDREYGDCFLMSWPGLPFICLSCQQCLCSCIAAFTVITLALSLCCCCSFLVQLWIPCSLVS